MQTEAAAPTINFHHNKIDAAAQAGFDAYLTGAKMPVKYQSDDLLACAWRAGQTQAANKQRQAAQK